MKHRQSTLVEELDKELAEVISKVTGKVSDRSDKESSEDEGDGIHAYLGVQYLNWGAVKSLGAATIRSTHASVLTDSDGPLSDGKVTDEEGFSSLWRDLAVVLAY